MLLLLSGLTRRAAWCRESARAMGADLDGLVCLIHAFARVVWCACDSRLVLAFISGHKLFSHFSVAIHNYRWNSVARVASCG